MTYGLSDSNVKVKLMITKILSVMAAVLQRACEEAQSWIQTLVQPTGCVQTASKYRKMLN
jgi:hypothetical protein